MREHVSKKRIIELTWNCTPDSYNNTCNGYQVDINGIGFQSDSEGGFTRAYGTESTFIGIAKTKKQFIDLVYNTINNENITL